MGTPSGIVVLADVRGEKPYLIKTTRTTIYRVDFNSVFIRDPQYTLV